MHNQTGMDVGLGIAYGAALGLLLFTMTGQFWYVGVGIALGIVFGAAFDANRRGGNAPGHR